MVVAGPMLVYIFPSQQVEEAWGQIIYNPGLLEVLLEQTTEAVAAAAASAAPVAGHHVADAAATAAAAAVVAAVTALPQGQQNTKHHTLPLLLPFYNLNA